MAYVFMTNMVMACVVMDHLILFGAVEQFRPVVMAYIYMAYVVMTNIVMAYVIMEHLVLFGAVEQFRLLEPKERHPPRADHFLFSQTPRSMPTANADGPAPIET